MKKAIAVTVLVCILTLGMLLYQSLLKDEEREEVVKVVEPTDDSFLLGEFYFNQDEDPAGPYDLGRARFYYMQAIQKDEARENQMLWYQLGRIDFLEGNFDDAIARFRRQYELFDNQVPAVHYMLGLAYGFRAKDSDDPEDFKLAEVNFEEYIQLHPDEPWPYVDLAWIYFMQGKFEDMKELLSSVIGEYEDNAWVTNMYGLALLNSGAREEAYMYFDKSLSVLEELSPEDWGEVYPGNNPESWASGLKQMRVAVAENLKLAEAD